MELVPRRKGEANLQCLMKLADGIAITKSSQTLSNNL